MAGHGGLLFTKELFLIRTLKNLPGTFSLGTAGSYLMDNLSSSDIEEAFGLLRQARANSLNVSEDELQTRESFEAFLGTSSNITIRSPADFELKGVIVLNPALYSRTFLTRNPAIFFFVTPDFARREILGDLLKISQGFVKDIGKGYTGCLFPVSPSCEEFVSALAAENFHSVAAIPNACNIASSRRLEEQFLYFKHLGGVAAKISTLSEMRRIMEEVFCVEADTEEISIKGIPYLPLDHLTPRNGVIRLRNVSPGDVSTIYQIFKAVSTMGRGYGMDETLSERMFKKTRLDGKYCFVLDDPKSDKVLGCVVIEESCWVRRRNHGLFDISLVLKPESFDLGLGTDLANIALAIGKDLGFTGSLSDTVVGNYRALAAMRRQGMLPVGIFPDAITMAGAEAKDIIVFYKDCASHPSFIKDVYTAPKTGYKNEHNPKL